MQQSKKTAKAGQSAFRKLGKRIAKEIGLAPMPLERDPDIGRFDPPGFYTVGRKALEPELRQRASQPKDT